MHELFARVKGIVKKDGKYLVLKRWMNDRIPDPFMWEFIDGEVNHGESPDDAILRLTSELLGVEGQIERIVYTWSNMLGDTQCIGIAYLLSIREDESHFVLTEDFGEWEWIARDQFNAYIENTYVLDDLKGVKL